MLETYSGVSINTNCTMSTFWVNSYTGDNYYKLHPVSGNGDCFFLAVAEAFRYEGSQVTVKKLRQLVARQLTQEIFEQYDLLWKQANQDHNTELMMQFMFMPGIENLMMLKKIALTSRFWANETAIALLERALRIKFIIFSEQKWRSKTFPCYVTPEIIDDSLDPQWYVMLTFNGRHYDLVKYKGVSRFTLDQLPPELKLDMAMALPIMGKKVIGWEWAARKRPDSSTETAQ